MKPKHFLFLTFFLFASLLGFGQRQCGTDRIHQENQIKNPELYKSQEDFKNEINKILESPKPLRLSSETIYTLPVVVHVIYNNTAGTNISDAQVFSQITVLNQDFRKQTGTPGFNSDPLGADTKIEFCLATRDPDGNPTNGIVRILNTKTEWTDSDESTLKGLSHWPSNQYCNIYVCKMHVDYLGYAQYPANYNLSGPEGDDGALDGIVIDYKAFGNTGVAGTSPRGLYGKGRTATHEVSHWLGLLHIWGQGSGCGTDYVSDTPLDQGANMDADCNDQSDCDGNSVFVQDMTNNYLDYSPDVCMNLFTIGQKDRMRAVIENSPTRFALLSSNGCSAPLSIGVKNNSGYGSVQALLEGNEDVYFEIFDLAGRTMKNGWLYGSSKSVPKDNMSQGFYILKISNKTISATQKIYIIE